MEDSKRGRCIQKLLDNGDLSADCFREFTNEARKGIPYSFKCKLSEDEISDLAQDAVVVAWSARGKCESAITFSKWLRGIAKNKTLEYWRNSKKNRERLSLDTSGVSSDSSGNRVTLQVPSPDDPAAEAIDYIVEQQFDSEILGKLTDKEAQVYLLRVAGGPHSEIATQLNIEENASKKRLERVRDKALAIFDMLDGSELL